MQNLFIYNADPNITSNVAEEASGKIKLDLRETCYKNMNCTEVAQGSAKCRALGLAELNHI
jgi:hypothetical protein